MKRLSTKEIRETFLAYFAEKNHQIIGSAPLLAKNDPTLLFINSGMAPLKKYFLGEETPPSSKLCNLQPCIRTIDIDEVGDRHHLTFFEMLGSWSIGDYYKEKAIALAYELLVDRFGFDPGKLFATIYKGDPKLQLASDNVSQAAWEKAGLAPGHIVPLGEDNFWGPAGATGPCGPCTEVFYDTGSEYGADYVPGGHFDTKKRYIEIWNAGVFMEFNKTEQGGFEPLPLKSVDTGSGLERMAFVMNGCGSVYETDVLAPVVNRVRQLFAGYSVTEEEIRMVTDHVRAATLIMAEGVAPSNESYGYIPRRLIRKCVAIATRAQLTGSDFSPVISEVISLLGAYYPHLISNKDFVVEQVRKEVADFEPVIARGLQKLDQDLKAPSLRTYSGKQAFDLVTAHGVPVDIIRTFLAGRGIGLDEKEYAENIEKHQAVSRSGNKLTGEKTGEALKSDLSSVVKGLPKTDFVGYNAMKCDSQIIRLARDGKACAAVEGEQVFVLAAQETPFYAESGGQVGDTGAIVSPTGEAQVDKTVKIDGVFLHYARLKKGKFLDGQEISLAVDEPSRLAIRRNHSATHLLHAALHSVIGPTAIQKGSLVDKDRLRFDFQYQCAMTGEQLERVEALVNGWIWQNLKASTQTSDYKTALASGAMALFAENYGDSVRVVKLGPVSAELCGGVHVEATGEIGLFIINSESGVARGIRRIEAVIGATALQTLQNRTRMLDEMAAALKVGRSDLPKQVQRLSQQAAAGKPRAEKSAAAPKPSSEKVYKLPRNIDLYVGQIDADIESVKAAGDRIIQKKEAGIVCLLSTQENKGVRVLVWVDPALSKSVNAKDVLSSLMPYVDGQGGGKSTFAQGGGLKIEGITKLLDEAERTVAQLLEWAN